jgi:hypothetical protein
VTCEGSEKSREKALRAQGKDGSFFSGPATSASLISARGLVGLYANVSDLTAFSKLIFVGRLR